MISTSRYDPYEHAEELGIQVLHRPIRAANGYWYPDHNIIVVRSSLKARYDRSSLAHEIGHAVHAHRDTKPKQEVIADRYAAENLIDLAECRDVLRWAGDFYTLAMELEVSPKIMRVYLNVHRLAS